MKYKTVFTFATSLIIALNGCGGGSKNSLTVAHGDTLTIAIDGTNALTVATDVYRIAAIDVPFTASQSMDASGNINSAACIDPNAISGNNGGMGMGMGMDMTFTNCELAAASPTGHLLNVNGSCNNSGIFGGVETVTGEEIMFTVLAKTMNLHAFSVTRDSYSMTSASGTLHRSDGTVAMFETVTDFAGTANAPTDGSLIVTGANGSKLRLTIINPGTSFTLEVDADGDGNYDNPQLQDWNTDFLAALP